MRHDPKTIRWCAAEITSLAAHYRTMRGCSGHAEGCSKAANMLIEFAAQIEDVDRDVFNQEKGETHKFRERED